MERDTYFHIHRIDENSLENDPFLSGDSVSIDDQFDNFYFNNQISPFGYATLEMNQMAQLHRKSIFEIYNEFEIQFPPFNILNYESLTVKEISEFDEIHAKATRVLEESGRALRHTLNLIRELIFEEVRLKNFPFRPSRKKCIWLCEDKNQLEDWLPNLGLKKYQILEVTCKGNIFKTDSKHIDTWELNVDEYYKQAIAYWDPKDYYKWPEILFSGELRILNRFDSITEINFNI